MKLSCSSYLPLHKFKIASSIFLSVVLCLLFFQPPTLVHFSSSPSFSRFNATLTSNRRILLLLLQLSNTKFSLLFPVLSNTIPRRQSPRFLLKPSPNLCECLPHSTLPFTKHAFSYNNTIPTCLGSILAHDQL